MKNYKAAELVEVLFAKIGNNQNSNPKKKKRKKKKSIFKYLIPSLPMTNRERERGKRKSYIWVIGLAI